MRASSQSNSYSGCKIPKQTEFNRNGIFFILKKYTYIHFFLQKNDKSKSIHVIFFGPKNTFFSSLRVQKIKKKSGGGGFHVSEFPSIKVSKFSRTEGGRDGVREEGRNNERPVN